MMASNMNEREYVKRMRKIQLSRSKGLGCRFQIFVREGEGGVEEEEEEEYDYHITIDSGRFLL